jgi:hypothetical protein
MRKTKVESRSLDEEVAIRLLGYRWVHWNSRGGGGPSDEKGRFLAPPDGLLSHHQVPAGSEVPIADDPHRYLPEFCQDLEAAFDVARSVGLLDVAHAILEVDDLGDWTVRTREGEVLAQARSLPEALCRASLRLVEAAPSARAG